jgi:NitT/TauT family transport system substrate-binding protein
MSRLVRILVGIAFAVVASGCMAGGSSVSSLPPGASPATSATLAPCVTPAKVGCAKLTVGLGYIPSVQFAPFYLADQAGYYRSAGLDVTFQNKIEADLVPLVGQGAIDIGVADGTDVIPAVSQGIPVRYIATIYGTFPSIVFAKASSGIKRAADLMGKKIGIPGRYGSSWIMLQALLDSAGLTPDDVTILEYPDYGQGVAVQQGAVDAATGFANNEPVQLELNGIKTVVLHVDNIVPLPGNGLIASVSTLDSKHAAVAGFVAATLRAMNEIAATPSKGLDAAIAAVPELAKDRATQMAILAATIATWASPTTSAGGLGAIDTDGWAASIGYLTKLGLVPHEVKVGDLVRDDFLPAAG